MVRASAHEPVATFCVFPSVFELTSAKLPKRHRCVVEGCSGCLATVT